MKPLREMVKVKVPEITLEQYSWKIIQPYMFSYTVSQKYYKSQPEIKNNPHDFTSKHSIKQAIIACLTKKKKKKKKEKKEKANVKDQ